MFHRTVYGSLSALVVVVLGASAIQCSSSSRDGYEVSPDAAPPPEQFVAPVDAVDAAADANVADGIEQDCAGEENTQIYVLTQRPDAIHRFDPATLTFSLVGKLDCPDRNTFSMAVDRRGYAWVLFKSGAIDRVRLSDLQCQEVVLNNVPVNMNVFGMGFAKDDSSAGESLFLHPYDGLYRVDLSTRGVSWVGKTIFPAITELTGTGDGKLFGYSPQTGVISRFDKTTGAALETYRTSAAGNGAYAFAHWGGDFWTFLDLSTEESTPGSTVYRYSPATNETTIAVPGAGMSIVGAGSSTCAPFKPVN
ncbi:hypothetical protein AKJ09_03215 [Labilithrix luteola]|uniref:Lipoprotein n=1 Tax=Labilithrix luteola TaxID=1391654 RepID=A0A0K1PT44_9BACT|nr:hypothetical protein [Labilithrix luteola]AKU96551.1 hypothetical protein AKJ09_03215 [Labilithrix luteola]